MILGKIQRYLGILFFTVLVFSQALIYVAVRASNDNNLLEAFFVEPAGENIDINDSIYFQAILSGQDNSLFDFVFFRLQNPQTGWEENFQAILQADGSWRAQSAWQPSYNYQSGGYYLSVEAHHYHQGILGDVYQSQYLFINLKSNISLAAGELDWAFFSSPQTETQVDLVVGNQGIDIDLNIHNTIDPDSINNIYFDIYREQDNGSLDLINSLAAELDSFSGEYSIWSSALSIDASNFEPGEYIISSRIESSNNLLTSAIVSTGFSVINSLISEQPDFTSSVEIIYPLDEEEISGDQIDILLRPDTLPQAGQTIVAELVYKDTESNLADKSYNLVATSSQGIYGVTIDMSDSSDEDLASGEPENNSFPNGQYDINFLLFDSGQTIRTDLGRVSIIINRALIDSRENQEIVINSPEVGTTIFGNNLDLNFVTNFSATNFVFSIFKQNDSTLGIDQTISPVSDGSSWQYTVSADDFDFVNGTYILTATATDSQGQQTSLGPISFYWQINSQEPTVENVSISTYLPNNAQVGPGDVLLASSNVLGLEFELLSSADSSLSYQLGNVSYIDCSNSAILGLDVVEQAASLGHNYCSYITISGQTLDNIENGNYYFLAQYRDNQDNISSDRVLLSYFDPENRDEELEAEFIFFGWGNTNTISGNFNILLGSNLDIDTGIELDLYSQISDNVLDSLLVSPVNWSQMDVFGISQTDYNDFPFVYISDSIDSGQWLNGLYTLSISDYPEISIEISIDNQNSPIINNNEEDIDDIEDNSNSNQNNDSSSQPSKSDVTTKASDLEDNNLAIDYYDTCSDQGISDEETCQRFRAMISSLDRACIDQGIYDAQACEDYLYRIEIDIECQENSIIDKEECKNYLLEKYSSQVDCQLDDVNLCNNILRNRYLSRLVSGQKDSDNLNQAVEPLLGTNISIGELSDNLQSSGIVSQDTLPINDREAKVLIVKSQKETVLEEEDKLTILSQAVIILDTDGDGLSDDLEIYYGSDINNPDSDGDGYDDGTEIKNGYNPIGQGLLFVERTNLDTILLAGDKIIEQPKEKSSKIDNSLLINSIDESDKKVQIFGQAQANTWINLYLYSELPLLMTTKTDASGNWSYFIKNSLNDGHHRVFVTVNDDTGKIVKQSRPISFLIKEAQAVTVDNYFDETVGSARVNSLFVYYILGGAFLIFLALGVIVFLNRNKNKNLEL